MDTVFNEMLECLKNIESSLQGNEYEQGPVYSVGGAIGSYNVRSPYNTEAEFCVIGALMIATAGNGVIIVSSNNPNLPTPSATSQYGLASLGSESNALDGYVLPISTTQSPILFDHWQPLGRGATVYVNVTGAAGFALVAFRRSLTRLIPTPPKREPHTHSQPTSRRGQRSFMAGFEAQYPHEDYIHEQIPETSDTAMNVANEMTPAQVALARLRDAQGKARR